MITIKLKCRKCGKPLKYLTEQNGVHINVLPEDCDCCNQLLSHCEIITTDKLQHMDRRFCKESGCGAYTENFNRFPNAFCVLRGHPLPDCTKSSREYYLWLSKQSDGI